MNMGSDDFAALILAAGYSSRMGSFKPLLPLGDSVVISRSIAAARQAGVDYIRVVVGHRAEELIPLLSSWQVQILINRNFAKGMYSSVQTAVESLRDNEKAFFLLPGDLPCIKPELLVRLMESYTQTKKRILYPCHRGQRGHPPLIASAFKGLILSQKPDGGLRSLLHQYEKEAWELEVEDEGILLDMDVPGDYHRIAALFLNDRIPSGRDCFGILQQNRVSEQRMEHSITVTRVAERLASCLNGYGFGLNLKLIKAAGLLHDLAKGQPNHAQTGRMLLIQMGYPEVADIVGSHMDIHLLSPDFVSEKEIVYLADKIVQDDCVVSLQKRFAKALAGHSGKDAVYQSVVKRLHNARMIQKRIELILGKNLENMEL